MKAIQITDYRPVIELALSDAKEPSEPQPGQAKVTIRASALNPIDWKMVEGELRRFAPLPFPFIPGSDFAGVVQAVGPGVTNIAVGQEVYGMVGYNRGGSGSLAEYAVGNAAFMWPKPTELSFDQAAAVPMAGLRAWHVLVELFQLKSGDKVLIHGGAGGIGTFAIQIAHQLGAHVVTTVSQEDIDFAKSLGADEAIDYRSQDFSQIVHNVDAVFDTVGGDTLKRSFPVLKTGGQITSMLWERFPELAALHQVNFIEQSESATPSSFTGLGNLLSSGKVRVHIDSTYSLLDTNKALDHLKNSHVRGKVVVRI